MNLREGTRRLALLLGAVGAIAGGFASYLELQPALEQRAAHIRFERLANSQVVGQARKECFGPWEKHLSTKENLPVKLVPPYCFMPIDDPNAANYTPSELNSGGIKAVHFENRETASIETQDGQTLYPTRAPGTWSYVLIAILPILGFFIPWGTVRAIGWVVAGFVEPR